MIEAIFPIVVPLIVTGMISGFLAGLLGVGGGIVIVPILAFLLETSGIHTTTPMHIAVGSSLAIIVPTSLISARVHMQLGNVDINVIRRLGPFVFLGALGGAIAADNLDNASLKALFGMLAVLIGVSFLVRVIVLRDGLPALAGRSILGASIGLISSLVGIGGGSLTVPTLVSCGWTMRRAVGSSALMGLVIAIPGMISFMIVGLGAASDWPLSTGYVWWPAVMVIAAAAYSTTKLGAIFSSKIDQALLRRVFGVFLMIVGARLVYSGLMGLDLL